jgi:hypothetical protein
MPPNLEIFYNSMNTSGRKMKVFGSSLTSASLSLAISHTHTYTGGSVGAPLFPASQPAVHAGEASGADVSRLPPRGDSNTCRSPGTELPPPSFLHDISGN